MTNKVIKIKRAKVKSVKIKKYSEKPFLYKAAALSGFKVFDTYQAVKQGVTFNEFGMSMYCGRQGAGKTMAMTEYLERMRREYPKALIVTNYGYKHETQPMNDWQDFFNIRNGTDGVIFAIDEIQNEFSSTQWKNFPESLLSEITQQRKQRVKIVATSQIFTRVAKPLREQCFDVVVCKTFMGRWTFTKCFDAVDYNDAIDSPEKKSNMTRLYRKSFIQDDNLRNLFDSYAKIEKMGRTEFMSKLERGS